jgi:hypothetical protein
MGGHAVSRVIVLTIDEASAVDSVLTASYVGMPAEKVKAMRHFREQLRTARSGILTAPDKDGAIVRAGFFRRY